MWLAVHRPLWFDEIFTLWAARLPFDTLLTILASDSGPPLFYVLEKPFVFAGERLLHSDVAARFLPLAATLAILGGAVTLPSRRARLRFVLLAAASPLLLIYSTEARAYALLALFGFLLFLLALVAPERWGVLAAIALLSAATLYTHYLALFAVGAFALVAAAEKRTRSALAILAGAVPFLFWIPVMVAQPHEAVAWMHEQPSQLVTGILSSLGGAGRIPAPFGPPLPPTLVAFGGALGLILAVTLGLASRRNPVLRRASAFLVLFFGAVLFASLVRPVAFAGRTEMAVLPVWLWAIALGAEESRFVRATSFAALLVAAVSSVMIVSAPRTESLPAKALDSLAGEARPGDVLFAGAHFYLPARLAADRSRLAIPVQAIPREQASHPGWSVAMRLRTEDSEAVARALRSAGPDDRVFFLVPPSYAGPLQRILGREGVTRAVVSSPPEMVLLAWSRR